VQAVRTVTKDVLGSIAEGGAARALVLLDLAVALLPEAAGLGARSAELFALLADLTADETRRKYLVAPRARASRNPLRPDNHNTNNGT
jgi:hypothetical protein